MSNSLQVFLEVWEAGTTLGFIPVIILCSYAAEKGWLDMLFCQGNSNKVTTFHSVSPHTDNVTFKYPLALVHWNIRNVIKIVFLFR